MQIPQKANRAWDTHNAKALRAWQSGFCFWLCPYLRCVPVKTPSYLNFVFKISKVLVLTYVIARFPLALNVHV